MNYKKAAKRGAKLLDLVHPGWATKINLDELEMGNGEYVPNNKCGCVLSQLDYHEKLDGDLGFEHEGEYWEGLKLIFSSAKVATSEYFGFTQLEDYDSWPELDEEWTRQIQKRVAA